MPIDERAMLSVRRAGVEPAHPEGGCFTGSWAHQCPADACFQVAQAGVEPADHQGLSLAALPICVPLASFCVPWHTAPSTGFEPAISCVTGRRALQAAPRGRIVPVAKVGVEPTASLVLSQGGLPVAYRAVCPGGSRTRIHSGLSRAALPRLRTWAEVVPDGVEPSFPGCGPASWPLDHGTVSISSGVTGNRTRTFSSVRSWRRPVGP